jgi:hypothetical protein
VGAWSLTVFAGQQNSDHAIRAGRGVWCGYVGFGLSEGWDRLSRIQPDGLAAEKVTRGEDL